MHFRKAAGCAPAAARSGFIEADDRRHTAGAADLFLDCVRCSDADDAVALAALALLARTEGHSWKLAA